MWHLYFYQGTKTTGRHLLETPFGILCQHVVIVLREKRSYWQILQAWKENDKVFAFYSSYKKRSKTCFCNLFDDLKSSLCLLHHLPPNQCAALFTIFLFFLHKRVKLFISLSVFTPRFLVWGICAQKSITKCSSLSFWGVTLCDLCRNNKPFCARQGHVAPIKAAINQWKTICDDKLIVHRGPQ